LISRPALKLLLGALLLYNLNFRPIPSGDTLPAALLPLQLVLHGRADFDACQPLLERYYGGDAYFLQAKGGHFYSRYPVAQSVLLTPLYLPLALAPGARRWPPATEILAARILEKLMASAIASASVTFLFLLLRRIVDERRGLLLAAVYGFATNTWSTSSQALWQHGASQLTTIVSLLCLARFLEDQRRWRDAAGAGLFAALSVAMRPTDILFFGVSVVVLLWKVRRPRLLAWYAGFGGLIGGPLAFYNLRLFGTVRGGYPQSFDGNFWSGLAGLTMSPSHGLLVYSPVLLFALAGPYFWRREVSKPALVLGPIAVLFTASQVALCARWPSWWGGDCYGPRLLTDVLPSVILLLAAAFGWVSRHRLLEGAFAAALVFSVGVQLIGAFSFPLGFHKPDAQWDWVHCPILENGRRGPTPAPYRVVAGFARDVLAGRSPDLEHTGMLIR
jgi:hypothetical protein